MSYRLKHIVYEIPVQLLCAVLIVSLQQVLLPKLRFISSLQNEWVFAESVQLLVISQQISNIQIPQGTNTWLSLLPVVLLCKTSQVGQICQRSLRFSLNNHSECGHLISNGTLLEQAEQPVALLIFGQFLIVFSVLKL